MSRQQLPSISKTESGHYCIVGSLTVDTVPQFVDKMTRMFEKNDPVQIIDLAGILKSDSSGVALLVEWMRQANRINTKIRFLNMPENMRAIVTVTGLRDILPLSD